MAASSGQNGTKLTPTDAKIMQQMLQDVHESTPNWSKITAHKNGHFMAQAQSNMSILTKQKPSRPSTEPYRCSRGSLSRGGSSPKGATRATDTTAQTMVFIAEKVRGHDNGKNTLTSYQLVLIGRDCERFFLQTGTLTYTHLRNI